MRFDRWDRWGPRLVAFAVAMLAGISAAYWMLRWPADDPLDGHHVPLAVQDGAAMALDEPALARLLGGAKVQGQTAVVSADSRWRLVGVVASAAGEGAALIAEDDLPARAYRVGSRIGDQWVLKSVAHRRAMLAVSAQAPVTLTLEVPEPAADPQPAAVSQRPGLAGAVGAGPQGRIRPGR